MQRHETSSRRGAVMSTIQRTRRPWKGPGRRAEGTMHPSTLVYQYHLYTSYESSTRRRIRKYRIMIDDALLIRPWSARAPCDASDG